MKSNKTEFNKKDKAQEPAEEVKAEKADMPKAEMPEEGCENSEEKKDGEKQEEKEACSAEKEAPQKEDEEELQIRYMRLAADFQNYKRRTEKEKSDIYAYANEQFALGLLEVIDNFERAFGSKESAGDDKFAEGMELILKQLKGVMDKNHITEIEAEGKPFDPNFHNAVLTEEPEGIESGTVTKVFQKGYMLNGKVIRPSMVAVAQ